MTAESKVKYRFLQIGDSVWTEALDLSGVSWGDLDSDLIPVFRPDSIHKASGPEPDTCTFQVVAAAKGEPPGDGIYLADNLSAQADRRTHAGTTATMYYPATPTGFLAEFSLIKVMESDTTEKVDPVCCFCGVVTDMELSVDANGGDVWTITITEIARWHMSRIGVYGSAFWRWNQSDAKWNADTLPVFNEDSKPDQYSAVDGTELERLINSHLNTRDGVTSVNGAAIFAGFWRLGNVLNYLRREWGMADGNGAVQTVNYLSGDGEDPAWPAAAADGTWAFLFLQGSDDQILQDLALGGMSLAQAIDTIVTKAGHYEWCCVWDDAQSTYRLKIYDALAGNGETAVDYTRGTLGGSVGTTPPTCLEADLHWSWAKCATQVKALGAKRRFELTVDSGSGEGFFGGIMGGWTTAQETAYLAAKGPDDDDPDQKNPSPFQRYIIAGDLDWSAVFNHADFLSGRRRALPGLLCKAFASDEQATDEPQRLDIRAWRYIDAAWERAPQHVSVRAVEDGSLLVTGIDPDTGERWGYDPEGECAYDVRFTIAVEDDSRLTTSAAVTDKPSGWPTLEDVIDAHTFVYEAQAGAVIPTDSGGDPTIDAIAADTTKGSGASPNVLKSDQARLDALATRTLATRAHPFLSGRLTIKDCDWTIYPGQKIGNLTGGGARPTLALNAIVESIDYHLGEGQESMTLHLGGDTA